MTSRGKVLEAALELTNMKLLRLIGYIPAKMFLALAKVLSKTPFNPSLWRAFVSSGQVGRASRAYQDGNHAESFRIYKEIADSDVAGANLIEKSVIATAQYFVGYMALHGEGVQKDLPLSQLYFRKAADLGNADAIDYLASNNRQKK